MTDEKIKKIAEEYIAYKYPKSYKEMKPYALKNAIKVISEIIIDFTERYCVVERSKVVEIIVPETANDDKITIITKGQFRDIPGSETFNKKEE